MFLKLIIKSRYKWRQNGNMEKIFVLRKYGVCIIGTIMNNNENTMFYNFDAKFCL